MTTARLIDTSEVDENQSRASNWIKVACVLAASTVIGVFLSRYVSMSITMLLTFYSLLGTLLATGLGLHRLWLDHRGPTVHIDEGGVAVYPTLTAIRVSYVFMIAVATWGPAAIVFYVLRPDSVGGIVLGISFSFLGYVLLRRTPYRPSNIHHSPIITLTPTHLGIHPLLSDVATTIPWDKQPRIEGIEQVKTTYDSYNLLHVSARDIKGTLRLDTMGLPLRFWQLKRIINHFNTHPEDRAILGTPGGIDLVAEIITAGGSA
ncbi:conserved hypothetical protein [Actinomyces sp. oral taxon 180 str. F0310]|nr:conserved hypothetical protein [Actinomyces sp. oral taxon 180 str. F0310]